MPEPDVYRRKKSAVVETIIARLVASGTAAQRAETAARIRSLNQQGDNDLLHLECILAALDVLSPNS